MCNLEKHAGYVLDLMFTNKFYEMCLIESSKPLVKSNIWHKSFEIKTSIEENENETIGQLYEVLSELIAANDILSRLDQMRDVNNAFEEFFNVLHNAMNTFAPIVEFVKSIDPLWYDKNLKHLKNVRNEVYKTAKLSGNFVEVTFTIWSQIRVYRRNRNDITKECWAKHRNSKY